MNKNIIIVIPIYKNNLSQNERVSLLQVECILDKYDICFVAPKSLKNTALVRRHDVKLFDDRYFESTQTYSELLLYHGFYEKFTNYDYILIYQLDAFIFENKLDKFCSMDYDYIGAPEPLAYDWECIGTRVGNGGLSLRKVDACLRVVMNKKEILKNCPIPDTMLKQEDLFFSYCGANEVIDFNTPPAKIANQFSCEYNLSRCFDQHKIQLPFGCHAWHRIEYEHWKYYIEKYGYKTEKGSKVFYTEEQSEFFARYKCINKFLNEKDDATLNRIIDLIRPDKDKIAVWGAGDDGKSICCILDAINISYIILDNNRYNSTTIFKPSSDLFLSRKFKIIIASLKYMDEMENELNKANLVQNDDYIRCNDIYKIILNNNINYYNSCKCTFLNLEGS